MTSADSQLVTVSGDHAGIITQLAPDLWGWVVRVPHNYVRDETGRSSSFDEAVADAKAAAARLGINSELTTRAVLS